jgi:hypothetical protein
VRREQSLYRRREQTGYSREEGTDRIFTG